MIILAIETSCDETAAAVTKFEHGRHNVLSNVIATQIEIHKKYGGVVPEVASRNHIENIDNVVKTALIQARIAIEDIDAIAVTYAPGLIGALLVGVNYAKSLAYAIKKPLIPVHHVEAHIAANFIENADLVPPLLALVVSGGHSSLIYVADYNRYETIASTRDDAAGEAFDKIARVLGLGYPGGPAISQAAKSGDPTAYKFPRAKLANTLDFSFSGLKTAVINEIHKAKQRGEKVNTSDVAASFQYAVCDVLVSHTIDAAKKLNISKIAIAGGVAANELLRVKLAEAAKGNGFQFYMPRLEYCTDNAVMVAVRAWYATSETIDIVALNAFATKSIERKEL